ncbi:MAG: transglycosylase protein, partial [candidate division NC10 bacterium]|nr:transglycosylase protein [candidate division NC10 bacterium]
MSLTSTPTRYVLLAALVGTLACAPTATHAQAKPPAKAEAKPAKTLTIDLTEIQKPWTGDLDGMIKRHTIRVLTVYSKTFYTVDKGVQRGAAFDAGRLFVE